MPNHFPVNEAEINSAFATWEGLRRRLYERERAWAYTVTVTGDPARLRPLRRELVQLRHDADSAFARAMGMLPRSDTPARS